LIVRNGLPDVNIVAPVTRGPKTLPRAGFSDEALIDSIQKDHSGMARDECLQHLRDADIL